MFHHPSIWLAKGKDFECNIQLWATTKKKKKMKWFSIWAQGQTSFILEFVPYVFSHFNIMQMGEKR